MPCTRLAVAASDFEDGPLSEGQGSITKFFGTSAVPKNAEGASDQRAEGTAATQSVQDNAAVPKPAKLAKSKQAAVASMFKAARVSTSSNPAVAEPPLVQTASVNSPADVKAAVNSPPRHETAALGSGLAEASEHKVAAGNEQDESTGKATETVAQAQTECGRWQDTACQPSSNGEQQHLNAQDHTVNSAKALSAERQRSDAGEATTAAGREPAEGVGGESILNDVDLAEQKRIMHDLWLERNALSARNGVKRSAPSQKTSSKRGKSSAGAVGKQTQLHALLKKAPP